MKRRTIVQTSLAAGLMAGMVALGLGKDEPPPFGKDVPWRLIAWPFPRDAWLPGQAWRRGALEVYVQPKIGFCGNCDTGVVTDEEVDRVADIHLLDERFVPAKEGLAVRIGNLSGRARLYRYQLIGGGTRHAEGVAVSKRCDLVIAVIVGNLLDERERTAALSAPRVEHGAGLDQPTARGALSVLPDRGPPGPLIVLVFRTASLRLAHDS